MNKAFKKKWVKALRSGEFEQADGSLKYADRYCCLGVAREILSPGSEEKVSDFDRSGVSISEEILSSNHRSAIGISYSDCVALAELNDEGFTFQEIAYLVENL